MPDVTIRDILRAWSLPGAGLGLQSHKCSNDTSNFELKAIRADRNYDSNSFCQELLIRGTLPIIP